MKLDTFFEKFGLLADAPGAVEKMRALVLALAFSGRLLPTENPWPLKRLKFLATKIGSGATPAGGRNSYFTKGIPLIRSMNVHFGGFDPKGLVFLSDEQAERLSNVKVQSADVLLNITGASIGRVTTAPPDMAGARVNQHVAIIRPGKEIDAKFLAEFLASPATQRMIDDVQVGATRQALTKGMIEQFEIPLPPLAEQKRIVAKADELMGLCDRLEAQQQERETRHAVLARASLARFADAPTPANLNFLFHKSYDIAPAELRKAILSLAVRGKLVPQDPADEPAEEAVRKVEKQAKPARFDKRSKARIQGVGALSVGQTEREIPDNWACVPLIQIARLESGHTPSRSRPDWWGGDVSWVGVVDARLHDGGTVFDTRQHTNKEGLANSAARMLPAGTVCVSRTASVGYVVILGRAMATSQDFVNWVPSEAVTSDWLRLVFTSEKDGFKRFSKGAVHQTIYYPEWLSTHTLLPPLAEQRRIVARVNALMALVDQLEAQVAASRATGEKLLEAVVAELTA